VKHLQSANDESERTAKEKTIHVSRGDMAEKEYYSPVSDDDTILDLLAETETMPSLTPQPADLETMPSVSFNIPSPEGVKICVHDFELEHFDSGIVITEEIIREVLQPNGDGIQLR